MAPSALADVRLAGAGTVGMAVRERRPVVTVDVLHDLAFLLMDLVERGLRAGDLLNRIAAVSGGRGGGRPAFASGSAGDPARIPAAQAATPRLVKEWLGSA